MLSAAERRPLLERLCRHQRAVVACSIVLLAVLAWSWIIEGAALPGRDSNSMIGMAPEYVGSDLHVVAMWWIMMAAMMLPSATPAILLYGRVRQHRGHDAVIASSWIFLAGYLLTWLMVSMVATALQSFAIRAGVVDAVMLRANSDVVAASTLIVAGLYQLSALKEACLINCQSPARFLSRYWRPGTIGALWLGLLHGVYCVGCCWLLMALLFVGGVMNFLWIVALAVLIAIEKLSPRGNFIARLAGTALILWGLVKLIA